MKQILIVLALLVSACSKETVTVEPNEPETNAIYRQGCFMDSYTTTTYVYKCRVAGQDCLAVFDVYEDSIISNSCPEGTFEDDGNNPWLP